MKPALSPRSSLSLLVLALAVPSVLLNGACSGGGAAADARDASGDAPSDGAPQPDAGATETRDDGPAPDAPADATVSVPDAAGASDAVTGGDAEPAGVWRKVATSATVYNRVAFCDGTFFILGTGAIATTTTGPVAGAVSIAAGYTLDEIACGPSSIVVVGRKNGAPFNGVILRSADAGASWKDVTPVQVGQGRLDSVIHAEGAFVVGGLSNTLLTSTDGMAWTSVVATAAGTNFIASDLAYGNKLYVAALGTFAYTSSNLTDWTYKGEISKKAVSRLLFLNGAFVALGEQKNLATSTDGATWTARNVPPSVSVSGNFTDAIFAAGSYTVVGSMATIVTSPDASDWSKDGDISGLSVQNLYGIAHGAGRRIAVGSLGVILVSP